MPESIVWYSAMEFRYYHTCWNCRHRVGIHGQYLEIATVSEAMDIGLEACDNCTTLRLGDGSCRRVVGEILGDTKD